MYNPPYTMSENEGDWILRDAHKCCIMRETYTIVSNILHALNTKDLTGLTEADEIAQGIINPTTKI